MLNENKNIDQLFREKLGDYEKTPPTILWTNIQGGLNAHRRIQRITIYKSVGVAAALILAFLAGWWMTNPDNKGAIRQEPFAEQRNVNTDSSNPTSVITGNLPGESIKSTARPAELQPKESRATSANRSSLASFAANTSFMDKPLDAIAPKSGELELFETEKEFLDELNNNFEVVRKLTDWIAKVKKDSLTDLKNNSAGVITDLFKNNTTNKSVEIAMNNPVRNDGRWSLKAEFAPVFNNQAQNSRPVVELVSNGAQNSKPQETISENTFSGGMVAGYKVGRRLIIKSGLVYNNIRQTTRNIDYMGVNNFFNVPGNSTIASTPAGQVSLKKMGNVSREATVMNFSYQLDNIVTNPVNNELKQDIEFIEIPLQATYKLIDSKFSAGITGGISTNILIGNSAILSENGEKISAGETANMRNVVYSSAVGIEMGYELTNRITLTVEPRLKHFINSLSTSKSVNYKPYQVGIVTGLTYSFN